jgi:hypothetical protein
MSERAESTENRLVRLGIVLPSQVPPIAALPMDIPVEIERVVEVDNGQGGPTQ